MIAFLETIRASGELRWKSEPIDKFRSLFDYLLFKKVQFKPISLRRPTNTLSPRPGP